jgi:transposase
MTLARRSCAGGREGRRDGHVTARLIAIANALEGINRASAARLAGMDRQTLRDWVHRDNAKELPGCAIDQPRTPAEANRRQMATLKAVVLAGTNPAVDKVARWRIVDLCRWVEERWGVSYSETGMLRLRWSLDLSHRKTDHATRRAARRPGKPSKRGGLLPA